MNCGKKQEKNNKGWIKLEELGILTSDYPTLYEQNNRASTIIDISKYDYDFFNVLDYRNNWLKVEYENQTGKYSGWLPPENQCANPYTTCN